MCSQYLVDRDRVLALVFSSFYNSSLSFFSSFFPFFHANVNSEGIAASVHEWIDGSVARECVACEYSILCTFFKVSSFEGREKKLSARKFVLRQRKRRR